MPANDLSLLQGTLDVLVMKALIFGSRHGYAVAGWIRQTTDGTLQSEDEHHYMAVYEFDGEEAFARFQESQAFRDLLAEYDRQFGEVSTRVREAYVQVYP